MVHASKYNSHNSERTGILRSIGALLIKEFGQAPIPRKDIILDLSRSSGAALVLRGRVQLLGDAPMEPEVLALAGWLRRSHMSSILFTTQLARHYPRSLHFADKVSGLLAVCIGHARSEYLMMFKSPMAASAPHMKTAGSEDRIAMENGIDHWISEPWTDGELAMAEQLGKQLHDARRRVGDISVISDMRRTR
jgi:light-regulated signal transduction histidine kinase (bacteriophytochrome)